MFEKLKKSLSQLAGKPQIALPSPINGEAVPLSQVPDRTFSEELLGKGAAVIPTDGRVVSPVNGKVLGIFRTCHALTLQSEDGVEILIHAGLDTVKLGGRLYTPHVAKHDTVKVGDLLIEFDLAAVVAEGYNPITPMIICNTEAYESVEGIFGAVKCGEPFINLVEK